jgi:type II secretory pathway predicted ATPase ExeA
VIALRALCDAHAIPLADLARAADISRSAVSQLANHGRWPVRDRARVRTDITEFLRTHGVTADWTRKQKAPKRANAPRPDSLADQAEEAPMLLRRETLHQSTREHFHLQRDPFVEPRETSEVYTASPDIRYVREAMIEKARFGGFLAIVGESGAGKSTLREELIDRLQREQQPVLVIQPYVLAMEDNDNKGKTLKSIHIAEAVMATVAPLTKTLSSPEARFRQLHTALRESSRAGHRHLLLIEEAHSLPVPTLKHLKRFLELKDGLRPLISIVLIGQPELAAKLSEQNPEVREVVQRIEMVHLPPLDTHLRPFLDHRFKSVGVALDQVIEADVLDAITSRLTTQTGTSRGVASNLYPLAVQNVLARGMNAAAALGAPKVTAAMVREGGR